MSKSKIPLISFIATLCLLGLATYWPHFTPSLAVNPEPHPANPSIPATNSLPDPTAIALSAAPSGVDAKVMMRVVVSLSVLAAALFVILWKNYDANDKKWAYGSVGAIVGYWLGGS